MDCVICGTVRDCGPYLEAVFRNIESLQHVLGTCETVMFYDASSDDSRELLRSQNCVVIENQEPPHELRTQRIAHARNGCLDWIRANHPDATYFVMMDMDGPNAGEMNVGVIEDCFERLDEWDGVSFNRDDYYDIFALCYPPFVYNCWSYGQDSTRVVDIIKTDISAKLADRTLMLEVISAFNGFAIYKTANFSGCRYSAEKSDFPNLLDLPTHDIPDNCEHIAFHVEARVRHGAKVMIHPEPAFS
jgi:hypothetical protein